MDYAFKKKEDKRHSKHFILKRATVTIEEATTKIYLTSDDQNILLGLYLKITLSRKMR